MDKKNIIKKENPLAYNKSLESFKNNHKSYYVLEILDQRTKKINGNEITKNIFNIKILKRLLSSQEMFESSFGIQKH